MLSRRFKVGDVCDLIGTDVRVILREYDRHEKIWYVESHQYGAMTAMSVDLKKVKL